jgi:hypothetical protein
LLHGSQSGANGTTWILSRAELNALRQHWTVIPGASVIARIQTVDGAEASYFSQSLTPVGNIQFGLAIDVTPQLAKGAVRMLIGLTSTEMIDSSATNVRSCRREGGRFWRPRGRSPLQKRRLRGDTLAVAKERLEYATQMRVLVEKLREVGKASPEEFEQAKLNESQAGAILTTLEKTR